MRLTQGSRLGPYLVGAPLGHGGMGEVYRAHDTRLERDVAIKILPSHLATDPRALARFEREAKAVAALSHPNILEIHDFGTTDGTAFAVTELLYGKTFRARLIEGPLPVRKAVEYCVQAAHGLAAAHDRGVVHRDLKPENLFVTREGRVKILDFGLAQSRVASNASADDLTQTCRTDPGTVLGTVGYMAPEQVRGEPADGRADIFALGAVLFELLTGQRAFRARTTAETFSLILNEDPPPLAISGRVFSPGLELIVHKCLEKHREERFRSAHDLALALTASLGTAGLTTEFVVPAGGSRWRRLAPLVLAGACGVAITLGVLALRGEFPAAGAHPQPRFRYVTFSGRDRSPAVSRDGKLWAFASDRDGTSRIWIRHVDGQGEMPVSRGPDDFPRFSPDGGQVLFSRLEGSSRSLYRVEVFGSDKRIVENAVAGDWAPDGAHVAFIRAGKRGAERVSVVGLATIDGSEVRELATFPYALQHPRWSPDGSTIAAVTLLPAGASVTSAPPVPAGAPQQVFFVKSDGSQQWTIDAPLRRRGISAASWTPDGRQVVYSQADSVVPAPGSTAVIIRQDVTTGTIADRHWSPERATVLDVAGNGSVLFDTRSPRQNLVETWMEPGNPAAAGWLSRGNSADRQPVYFRDGERIVFASNRTGSVDLWMVSIGDRRATQLTSAGAIEWDPALAAGDSMLLYSSDQSGHFEIWTASATDGSGARQVTSDGANAENPTATPDGQWIAYSSGHPEKRGLWKIRADGSQAARLVAGHVQVPAVSPDGKYVLYREPPGEGAVRVQVVYLADGAPARSSILVPIVKPTEVGLGRARWMPGGKAIAFLGQNAAGVVGVFVQDFDPGRDTTHTRRPLGGFDSEYVAESFDISPEGHRLVVAAWQQVFSLMEGHPVDGLMARGR